MRAKRVDSNQQELVKAIKLTGASVLYLHTLGRGCPDILIGYQGNNYLVEIKDGNKPPSQRKLTEDQVDFHSLWKGQIAIIDSVSKALELLGVT